MNECEMCGNELCIQNIILPQLRCPLNMKLLLLKYFFFLNLYISPKSKYSVYFLHIPILRI